MPSLRPFFEALQRRRHRSDQVLAIDSPGGGTATDGEGSDAPLPHTASAAAAAAGAVAAVDSSPFRSRHASAPVAIPQASVSQECSKPLSSSLGSAGSNSPNNSLTGKLHRICRSTDRDREYEVLDIVRCSRGAIYLGRELLRPKQKQKGAEGGSSSSSNDNDTGGGEGKPVAMKQLPWSVYQYQPKSEAAFLASLEHPNVVRFVETAVDGNTGTQYIVLEFIPGESLRTMAHKRPHTGLPVSAVHRYAKHIACGLAFLHARGVVHGNVKPANVLIDERTDTAKLAEFGLSAASISGMDGIGALLFHRVVVAASGSEGLGVRPRETLFYMAPELVVSSASASRASDVWAFGITFLEAATGRRAWPHDSDGYDLVLRIATQLPQVGTGVPPLLRDMLSSCLQHEVDARPSASQLLRHAFFTSTPPALSVSEEGESGGGGGGGGDHRWASPSASRTEIRRFSTSLAVFEDNDDAFDDIDEEA